MEEVSEHNSKKSCWTVIKGSVYDVTDYLDEHPGGEAMLEGCGRDSTKMFENKPSGKSHSNEARKLLETYKIGQLGK